MGGGRQGRWPPRAARVEPEADHGGRPCSGVHGPDPAEVRARRAREQDSDEPGRRAPDPHPERRRGDPPAGSRLLRHHAVGRPGGPWSLPRPARRQERQPGAQHDTPVHRRGGRARPRHHLPLAHLRRGLRPHHLRLRRRVPRRGGDGLRGRRPSRGVHRRGGPDADRELGHLAGGERAPDRHGGGHDALHRPGRCVVLRRAGRRQRDQPARGGRADDDGRTARRGGERRPDARTGRLAAR